VCPLLREKARQFGTLYPESRGQHQHRTLWESGESDYGRGIPRIGESQLYLRTEETWEFRCGEPSRTLEDVTKDITKDVTKPLTTGMKIKAQKMMNDSRPMETMVVVTEYGSTRVSEAHDGWDRYIVMYEKGTPSPYPFHSDCTQTSYL
jgi:hypothetical protein